MAHKYRAKPTEVDGIKFHSQKEARRYQELRLLEKAGEIIRLEVQPRFQLCVAGDDGLARHVGDYVADFAYDSLDPAATCRTYEDVKGFKTPLYRWKKKHVEAQYGVTIVEI